MFGNVRFHGPRPQTGSGCTNVKDVVGIASPDAGGYWLAAANGAVYSFGDAQNFGDTAARTLVRPIVGISAP